MTRADVWGRVTSLCAGTPFAFTQAVSPFDFTQQPTGLIDEVFRVTVEQGEVIGGFNFSEERTDLVTIWLARKHLAAPEQMYETLVTDITSLTSAVVRSGVVVGDFAVPDGGSAAIEHEAGREFAVARLTLPINYELTL